MLSRMEKEPQTVMADLEELRNRIVARPGAVFDCTAEASGLSQAESHARRLLQALPQLRPGAAGGIGETPMRLPAAEAFIAPAQINYVGKAANSMIRAIKITSLHCYHALPVPLGNCR